MTTVNCGGTGCRPNARKREVFRTIILPAALYKHGHDRLCWLSQQGMEKESCIRRLKAQETMGISLITSPPVVLALDPAN